MRVVPCLDVFVRIFDHDHGGIDHGANGDGDAAQRHDVRVHPLVVHYRKGDQDTDRQRHDCHEGRAQVEQEDSTDDGDHDEFLDQLVLEVVYSAFDQVRPVVGGYQFDACRQACFQLIELDLDRIDCFQRVFADRMMMTPPATSPSPFK